MRFKGELLKKLRKESGYTQEKLSDITKIPKNTIQNYEQGKHVPNLFNIFKLAYVFDIYMEDFIEVEEEELPDIWSE
jgi:transcriptional regulator with XRE-family HTH domain